jgi:DNA-binding phage protein
MTDQWTDRLSEYLDDELAPEERTALEAHLRDCAVCADVLAELRHVVARARGLEDIAPEHELWPGVARRIGAVRPLRPSRPGWTFTLPQLAAAGIALMVLSGGTAWMLHPTATLVQAPAIAATPTPPLPPSAIAASAGRRPGNLGYDQAVAELESVLQSGRGRLDSVTVRVIERNLATIDSAIAQARRAVAADSANLYLNAHLAETMRRKLELLRQAASLVTAVS